MDINKVWHYSRYQHLLALASLTRSVRTRSEEYRAALYVLSGNEQLYEAAKEFVSEVGIRFDLIMALAKNRRLGDGAYVAMDTAACLYYGPEKRPIDWLGFSALDDGMLRVVLDALNVRCVDCFRPVMNMVK